MRDNSGTCWNCRKTLSPSDYGRQESCEGCGRDTHVCRNCTFYDPKYHNGCRENQADRVLEKERANFCDYFNPRNEHKDPAQEQKDLRSAAESLFKK